MFYLSDYFKCVVCGKARRGGHVFIGLSQNRRKTCFALPRIVRHRQHVCGQHVSSLLAAQTNGCKSAHFPPKRQLFAFFDKLQEVLVAVPRDAFSEVVTTKKGAYLNLLPTAACWGIATAAHRKARGCNRPIRKGDRERGGRPHRGASPLRSRQDRGCCAAVSRRWWPDCSGRNPLLSHAGRLCLSRPWTVLRHHSAT